MGGLRSRSERPTFLSVLLRSLARLFSILCPVWAAKRDGYPLCVARHRGLRLEGRLTLVLKARRRSLFVRALGFGDSCIFFARLGRQRKREAWKLGLTLQQLKLHPVFLLLIKPDVLSLSSARSGRLNLVCSPLWAPKREEKALVNYMDRLRSESSFSFLLQVPALLSFRESWPGSRPAYASSGLATGRLRSFALQGAAPPLFGVRKLTWATAPSVFAGRNSRSDETQGATPSLFRKAKLTRKGAISWLREEVVLMGWRHL